MKKILISLVLLSTPVYSTPITITNGSISTNWGSPTPYFDTTVELSGENFSFGNWFSHDAFKFLFLPNPLFDSPLNLVPGQEINLSGKTILSPRYPASYGNEFYYLLGELNLVTPTTLVSSSLTVPFTLNGQIQGILLGDGALSNFEISGSGILNTYLVDKGDCLELLDIAYEINPIPEPGTLLLLGLGLILLKRKIA